jgi:hypothetical protein
VIKLDIVNAVVTTTNISRTKAEQAVETVFESLKNALGRGQRIELRRFGVFSVNKGEVCKTSIRGFESHPRLQFSQANTFLLGEGAMPWKEFEKTPSEAR